MQENLVMLIVDDAEVNRASFSAMFMDEYKILTARDGQGRCGFCIRKR